MSSCKMGAVGAHMMARVLRLPHCRLHTLVLENQRVGMTGAQALVSAIQAGALVERLSLKLNFIRDEGGEHFIELLRSFREDACVLEELDLSNNLLSFHTCTQLQLVKPERLTLVLKGNRVLDEVLNATSHAIGTVLVIIGSVFLGIAVAELPVTGTYEGSASVEHSLYGAAPPHGM